jgi:hypothetical protein
MRAETGMETSSPLMDMMTFGSKTFGRDHEDWDHSGLGVRAYVLVERNGGDKKRKQRTALTSMQGLMHIDMELAGEVAVGVESGLDMEKEIGTAGPCGAPPRLRLESEIEGAEERGRRGEESVGGKQMRKERLRKSKGGRWLCEKTSRRRWSA